MRLKLILLGVLFVFSGLVAVVLWRLGDHDLERRQSEPFAFVSTGDEISGTLWLPDVEPLAAVALVHGDGPQDRVSGGGYAPLINVFLDAGIAVVSWDKPGVGRSVGDWLQQSMQDRADEVRAALIQLGERFPGFAVGALGFSQAGWVLPRLQRGDADFLVLVGPAISWQRQGEYYTRMRLTGAGADADEIERELARQTKADNRIFAADAQFDAELTSEGLNEERWNFIRRNRYEDAEVFLAHLEIPLLAIWGEEDLNVDAKADSAIYQQLTMRNLQKRIVLHPHATHGLLKAGPYNWQLESQWSSLAKIRFLLEGRNAYAPGALETIYTWILTVSAKMASR